MDRWKEITESRRIMECQKLSNQRSEISGHELVWTHFMSQNIIEIWSSNVTVMSSMLETVRVCRPLVNQFSGTTSCPEIQWRPVSFTQKAEMLKSFFACEENAEKSVSIRFKGSKFQDEVSWSQFGLKFMSRNIDANEQIASPFLYMYWTCMTYIL